MPLPDPQPRSHFHTRSVQFEGFHREDGLWDIEAALVDRKTYPASVHDGGERPAGAPVHALSIRLTVDDDFIVHAVQTSMDVAPFDNCRGAVPPMEGVVGAKLGPGWRLAIDRALGGVKGCTHLRELLFNMATAAYQTIPSGRAHLRASAGEPEPPRDTPPPHVGHCMSWDVNGPLVARYYPQFVDWAPLRRRDRKLP